MISAELVKHSPDIIFQIISNIFNSIVSTGEHPKKIKHGLLPALQKPESGYGKELYFGFLYSVFLD